MDELHPQYNYCIHETNEAWDCTVCYACKDIITVTIKINYKIRTVKYAAGLWNVPKGWLEI